MAPASIPIAAIGLINQTVAQQSALLAYIDVFREIGIVAPLAAALAIRRASAVSRRPTRSKGSRLRWARLMMTAPSVAEMIESFGLRVRQAMNQVVVGTVMGGAQPFAAALDYEEWEDVVGTVLWLASDASAFVTGTVVAVDGGFSAAAGI